MSLRATHARQVLARIAAIPPGYVRTYGDVSPGAPRFAGTVLHGEHGDVPWHRVVRADGSLTQGERQRRLLLEEGVPFRGARVDMRVARLDPLDATGEPAVDINPKKARRHGHT